MARFDTLGLQYFTDGGALLGGGLLNFYEPGTTPSPANRKTTYSDAAMTVANTNPVVIDADGRAPNIFFSGVARCVLTDSAGVVIEDKDPVGDDGAMANAFAAWVADRTYSLNQPVTASDGYIYTSRINNNIGNDPISSPTQWQLIAKTIGFDDSNNGYVYTVDTSEDLKIAAVPKNTIRALVPISTVTVSSSVAAVDFTGIDGTYDEYVLSIINARPVTDGAYADMRTSSDNGSIFDSESNTYRFLSTSSAQTTASYIRLGGGGVGNSDEGETGFNANIRILSPANTTLYKEFLWQYSANKPDANSEQGTGCGRRNSIAIVNAVRFFFSTGNVASGIFTLYGMRQS